MYRLRKSAKSRSVHIVNTVSGSSLHLGKPTVAVLEILKTYEGYTITYSKKVDAVDEKRLNYQSPWDIEISEHTAKLLTSKIMLTPKPRKKDNTTRTSEHKNSNNPYANMSLQDALLFGLK